jgi:hypothetical protein
MDLVGAIIPAVATKVSVDIQMNSRKSKKSRE